MKMFTWQLCFTFYHKNTLAELAYFSNIYEDHLQSLWTHCITPSQNFVEVWWQFLFQVPPWQAMHFLQCSTHLKICCRLFVT